MAAIRPIPKAVHSSLRSGTVLFDLTRVVEELVYNSLDAGAKKVSVYVGIKTCYIKVVDNGFGITRDGLMLLGEKYTTSKMKSLADMDAPSTSFGFRGEALGSVSDISVLEIITKTHGMPNGYRKIIKGCKCLYFGVDDTRQDVGTTVTVRDLYYNQPVRRRQMLDGPRKLLHSVKKCVLRIALMHPRLSFTVIDVESEEQLFSTQESTSPLPLMIKHFGAETCEDLLELNTADGMLRLSGYISGPRDTSAPKALQLIYINLRYVGKCLIHKLLNELASRFAFPGALTVSKRNKTKMHPNFLLNLACPQSFYVLSFEPSHTSVEFKDWSSLLTFIERTILKLWNEKRSGEIPRNVAAFEEGNQFIPLKEDARTRLRDVDDICWIQDAKTSVGCLTEIRRQKQGSESPSIPSFQSYTITKDIEYQKSARGLVSDMTCPARDCDKKTNWAKERSDNYQYPEDEISYLDDESQIYKSDFAEWGRNNVREYPSRIEEDLFQVRPYEYRDKVHSEDYLKFRDDISSFSYKPFLQSCSTRESASSGGLLCAMAYKDDIFIKQRNHVNLLDGVDATEDESYTNFEFAGSSGEIDLITDAYSCSPDKRYSRCRSQRQFVDIIDIADSITDDCYQMDSCVTGVQWQDDPVSGLLSPPSKILCSLNRDRMVQLQNVDHAVKKFCLSHGDKADCGSDNLSFDIETSDSIYQDTFGYSREWLGRPSSEPEPKHQKCAYRGDLLSREMEDVLVEHDVSLRNIEDNCCDTSLEFDNRKYVNKNVHKCIDSKYQDDYWFTENESLFASDANSCYNSCYMDTVKANTRSKPPFNDIPSSSVSFEYKGRKLQCQADECSRQERVRSHSAPPFFRSKKKFVALCDYTSKAKHSVSKLASKTSVTQEVEGLEDLPQSSGASHPNPKPNNVENLFCARSHKRITPERDFDMLEIPMKKLRMRTSLDHIQSNLPEDQSPKEIRMSVASGIKWRDSSQISTTEQFRNFHHEKRPHDQQSILDLSSGILQYSSDVLVPECVDKDCIMDAKVLQQVDLKFIPIVGRGILAVIDQHAADERIKLEELRRKVLSGEVKTTTYLDEEQVMELPEVGYQLLHKYATQIENWGWICNVHAQASDSFTKNMNLLQAPSVKPILLAVPCILGISLSDVDLLEYLQQLADTDGSSTIPPAILRILNSKACRGAIMFGDFLLPSECSLLVEELKNTSLCFQCAHGRPTTVPLVNLKALHEQIAKLPTSNGGSYESWHGLCRHQISVDRLQKQLHPAGC